MVKVLALYSCWPAALSTTLISRLTFKYRFSCCATIVPTSTYKRALRSIISLSKPSARPASASNSLAKAMSSGCFSPLSSLIPGACSASSRVGPNQVPGGNGWPTWKSPTLMVSIISWRFMASEIALRTRASLKGAFSVFIINT